MKLSDNSKRFLKRFLVVLSFLAFFCIVFLFACNLLSGLSYLYRSKSVAYRIYNFFVIALLVLAVLIVLSVLLLRRNSKFIIKIISTVLLISFVLVSPYGILIGMVAVIITPGCSYTENVANYGIYDEDIPLVIDHFPEKITEDMMVVAFSYFYKYADTFQIDLYLEVKFSDRTTMEQYLLTATEAFSEYGSVSSPNPYHEGYTDIIGLTRYSSDRPGEYLVAHVRFDQFESGYRYVEMNYASITYSYEELTIIYNDTRLGSDIEWGNDPDHGEHTPHLLRRFGVEWGEENNYKKTYIKENDN